MTGPRQLAEEQLRWPDPSGMRQRLARELLSALDERDSWRDVAGTRAEALDRYRPRAVVAGARAAAYEQALREIREWVESGLDRVQPLHAVVRAIDKTAREALVAAEETKP